MIRLRRPSKIEIAAALAAAADSEGVRDAKPDSARRDAFSHAEVGATADPSAVSALASRYAVDRRRFALGRGIDFYEAARSGLFAWRHFEIPWLSLHGGSTSVREGQVVATLTRVFGLWFLNPCRVVYREDGIASGDAARSSTRSATFAYGTLPGHVACGEERFALRHDPATDEVVFEIFAFSRPAIALTRIGRPFMRRIQRRFAVDSANALARACGTSAATEIPSTTTA